MFVEAERVVALRFEAAAAALDRALADGGLVPESRRAVADGLSFVMPVGPRGGHFPAREVAVQLLPARRTDRYVIVAVRWQATGATGRLFPALDADLKLEAGKEPDTSRLSVLGRYEPPLAGAGEVL